MLRFAVVTPYFEEPIEKLARCHRSVLDQSYKDVIHIFVGDGRRQEDIDSWPRTQHITLPLPHSDFGDTPRLIGAASAAGLQFEAVLFLDADNWYAENHIETLYSLGRSSGADVVTSSRYLCRPDTGEVLGVCTECDGLNFVDSNCYMFFDSAFYILSAWGLRGNSAVRSGVSVIGDRVLWHAIQNSNLQRTHSMRPTVFYETSFAAHYLARGIDVPGFAKVIRYDKNQNRYCIEPYAG
ncbi:glycosyltransferase [Alicyclobacillus sacchari]|uniref:glycosyltransferase family 2 protein n=1 Tax=Alicyclobacillus sacchari TaxID=392010 RepID=UPI001AB03564